MRQRNRPWIFIEVVFGIGLASMLCRMPTYLAIEDSPHIPYTQQAVDHPIPRLWGVTLILGRFFFLDLLLGTTSTMTLAPLSLAPCFPFFPLASFFMVCGWPRAPLPLLIPGLLPYFRHPLDSSI